jgi:sugar transferase (PEP-CTERM/EpsH1 system associated)
MTVKASGSRIRILHVVQSLGTGGLENGVINLANGIDRHRYELDVLCLRFIGELRTRLTNHSEVFFDSRTSTSIARSIVAVRHYCRTRKYSIVHTHGWATLLPGFLGARAAGGACTINGEHGTFFADTARRRIAQRLLFRLVDANCTVSRSLRDEMQQIFSHSRATVSTIVNGVDTDRFKPNAVTRAETRRALGMDANEILFGTVGRLVPVKDYRTLINAFRTLSTECPNARLILVGDGPDLADLRTLAGDLVDSRKVIFVGNRDDVPSLMNAMDVFCLTSLREGLSNTLLEAHACGLPVLATRTGGNGEVVASGKTGYLCDVGDVTELAMLMKNLATQRPLRDQFGAAARERAVNEFSIARMVDAYEELYERVLRD